MSKFNVGDKVKIVDKWNEHTYQNRDGEMDKWLGKVMTIREITPWGSYFMEEDETEHCGTGWLWNDACIEGLAKVNKFNVGERYKVGANALVEAGNTIEITGVDCNRVYYKTIEAVAGSNKVSDDFDARSAFAEKLIPVTGDEEKIIITRKGNKTYAKRYVNNTVVEKALARCNPVDEFDFNIGAKIAFDRLLGIEASTVNETEDMWKLFVEHKVSVHVTRENIMDFLRECEKRGFKWRTCQKATEESPFDYENIDECWIDYGFDGNYLGYWHPMSEYTPPVHEASEFIEDVKIIEII